jgi:hypothetical protein
LAIGGIDILAFDFASTHLSDVWLGGKAFLNFRN